MAISIKILRITIGLLFVFSGVIKILDPGLFEETVTLFNVLPQYSKLFAILIPPFEIVAGLSLVMGIFRKAAILVLVPLLVSYIISIWLNLREGFVFDCGCFGPLQLFSRISTGKIIFNITLVTALLIIFIIDKHKVDLLSHLKIVGTYASLIAMISYVPYSNISWAYKINEQNIKDIDWRTAGSLITTERAVLFDARTKEQYDREHVPGALSLPFLDFNNQFKNFSKINKDAAIIVYCDGRDCSAATRTCQKLIARGYKNTYRVTGGFDAWNTKT